MSAISSAEIRRLVRETLRELLPANRTNPEAGEGTLSARLRSALADPKAPPVAVRMRNAADLNAFARSWEGEPPGEPRTLPRPWAEPARPSLALPESRRAIWSSGKSDCIQSPTGRPRRVATLIMARAV